MLELTGLTVRYGSLTIVDNVSLTLNEREWLMLVGPNGAGKSTIVSAIAQCVPYTGRVTFEGRDVAAMKPLAAARCFGVLTQNHAMGYAFTVEEVVRLGRYAYTKGLFSPKNEDNEQKVADALRLTGLEPFRNQSVLTLSGGELQRTFLAQLLAQDPRLLILDEPTNHLDLAYQRDIFELVKGWAAEKGRAVLSVVHDLSLARLYGTHAALLDAGRVVSIGATGDVLSEENLQNVYGMDVYGWMRQLLSQWQTPPVGTQPPDAKNE